MKLGIYGGAFNPIHYGHLRTAEDVADELSLDKILFIPSGRPAFKKPQLAGASHRFRMVKLAVEENPLFSASDIEIKTRGKSFSSDTVKKLKKRYKDASLFFILGIDTFTDLPDWKEPDKLLEMSNIVVISRPGHSFSELSSSPYLKKIREKILNELDSGERKRFSLRMSTGQRCFLLRVTGLNISASLIRKLSVSGKSTKYLLPDSVKSYIISNKLFKN